MFIVQEGMSRDLPPLLVLHPSNPIQPGKCLVVDGNHRLHAIRHLLEDFTMSDKQRLSLKTVNVAILHPQTPKQALRKLCLCT